MTGITCKWSDARDCCECDEPVCLRTLHGREEEDEDNPSADE